MRLPIHAGAPETAAKSTASANTNRPGQRSPQISQRAPVGVGDREEVDPPLLKRVFGRVR